MTESLHPAPTHQLPAFVTAPGQTDFLFVSTAIFVLAAMIGIGISYFKLHALPERARRAWRTTDHDPPTTHRYALL